MSTPEPAQIHLSFQDFIRDPNVVWYGPHACNKCGKMIVKSSFETGGKELDAEDYNHHYPNFRWHQHVCDPKDIAGLPSAMTPDVAEMASRLNQHPIWNPSNA